MMQRQYRRGGTKSEWISAKISKLVKEGRPQDQAVAIAYSMYNKMHEDGGQQQIEDYSSEAPFLGNNPYTGQPNDFPLPTQIPPQILAHDQQVIPQFDLGGMGVLKQPDLTYPTLATWKDNQDPNKPFSLFKESQTTDTGVKSLQPKMPSKIPMTSLGITADKLPELKPVTQPYTQQDAKTKPLYQFENPYGEIDFGQSLMGLGSSIKQGDVGGAALYGVNALAKGTKAFLQGYGTENRKQNILKSFADRYRRSLTGENSTQSMKMGGSFYEEGGQEAMAEGETPQFEQQEQSQEQQLLPQIAQALQQGAKPEQLVAQLVQSGMDQEDAVEVVQQAMQPQFEEGGQQEQMQALVQQVAQAIQTGADPNQILQQLVESGVPQEVAQQILQMVMQQMQGQQEQAPQEQQPAQQPQFKDGGEVLAFLANKTIKGHSYNPKTDSYEIIYG